MRIRFQPFFQRFSYHLDGAGIDRCSERMEQELTQLGVERQNRIRIRFSFEEALLRLRDRFGEKTPFDLIVRDRFGSSSVQIEVEGDIYNPLSKTDAELEDWSSSLLTVVGLSPLYSYSRGRNILRVNLPRRGMNAALKLLIAVFAGLILGLVLREALSTDSELRLVSLILSPMNDFWARMLSLLSGPALFLMTCTAVLNSRKIEEEGVNGNHLLLRYIAITLAAGIATIVIAVLFAVRALTWSAEVGIGLFATLLNFMPEDLFSPLIGAQPQQILLLAIVLGNGLSIVGPKAHELRTLVREGNMLGLTMTESVSRCSPFFLAALIVLELLRGHVPDFRGVLMALLLALAATGLFLAGMSLYIARRQQVSPLLLTKKLLPAFLHTIRSGGIDEGFGQMERGCVHDLGLERRFVHVSLPHGIVLYMPGSVIGAIIFTLFSAVRYSIEMDSTWLVTALLLSVVLFVAEPPVPGANLLAYIMIFRQLGIPSYALIDAMVFDALFGLFATAANQSLLQLDLILQAERLGLLNRERLKAPVSERKQAA